MMADGLQLTEMIFRDEVVKPNPRRLRKLNPLKTIREWCEIDRMESGESWRPTHS